MNYLWIAIGLFLILVGIIGFVRTFMSDFDARRGALPILANGTLETARAISAAGCIVSSVLGAWTTMHYWP